MGSRVGYEYDYRFSLVEANEINSRFKSKRKEGVKTCLFEFRTNFILKGRPQEGVIIMDSEKFDAYMYPMGDGMKDIMCLYCMTYYRLKEYWMHTEEIYLLLNRTLDFTRQVISDPQHASLNPIPVVVHLDVYTVQQEGESFGDAMDRAIRAQYLVPLYMWPHPTTVVSLPGRFCSFFWSLRRMRVEKVEEGLARMPVCLICSRTSNIGAYITLLFCGHGFHSHCIVRWLERNNLCPSCHSEAYDRRLIFGNSFK